MRVEVPLVSGNRVRALQHRKEIGQQVDQHGPVVSFPVFPGDVTARVNVPVLVFANKST
jgi:hypothetical protein